MGEGFAALPFRITTVFGVGYRLDRLEDAASPAAPAAPAEDDV